MAGDDEVLRIAAQFDVAEITAGMDIAANAVQTGAQRMAASMQKSGLSAEETASALKNLGYSADEAKAALGTAAAELNQVAAASDRTARSVNNSRIAFTGLTQDLGLRGSRALGSFIAQSSSLAPILSAAFPVVAAVALFEIVDTGIEKLHKLAMAGQLEAEAWQKIDHESTVALDGANKGVEGLEVKLTELTSGKMEALRLQFQFITDGAIEMSTKMLSFFDQMGKQEDEQIGKLGRIGQLITAVVNDGALGAGLQIAMPTQGEAIKGFGSQLSKTLDTEGTAAGIHLVAEQIRTLNEQLAKHPDAKGLAEYRDQLLKVRDLLNSGLKTEALEKAVNVAEQAKESAAEAEKAAREAAKLAKEYEESLKAILRMTEAQDKLVAGATKLADEQKQFGSQAELKGAEQQLKALQEISNAEEKFRNESMQRAMGATDFAINEKIREVQAEKSLGEISVRDASAQINALVSQRLAAEEKMLNDEIALISSRLEQERAIDAKGYAQDLAALSVALKKKQQFVQQAAVQMERSDDQANQKMIQSFKKAFDQITSEFNRSIISWANGTESFGRAVEKVWTGIADTSIEAILKMGENYLEGIAVKKAMALISKQTDASTAASGAYASQAAIPIVGPELGAAAAAVAYADVMAFARGGIMGSNEGLALLHPREMVLPSHISQSVQQMAASNTGGSGGGHFHTEIHIHGNPSSSEISKVEKQMTAVIRRARRRGNL